MFQIFLTRSNKYLPSNIFTRSVEKTGTLLSAWFTCFMFVFWKLLCFDRLISPERPSQPISASLEDSSNSVVFAIERGKDSLTANLYKNILYCVLNQECSKKWASKVFPCDKGVICFWSYAVKVEFCANLLHKYCLFAFNSHRLARTMKPFLREIMS